MAIRYRAGRKTPWQVYWNNPHTGKRESESFATEQEAKKNDSLVNHRLKFDRESFPNHEDEQNSNEEAHQQKENTLEAVYLQYLRANQFCLKEVKRKVFSMRKIFATLGHKDIAEISKKDVATVMQTLAKTGIKPVTVRSYTSVLRAFMNWASENDYCAPLQFPKMPPAHYEKFIPPTPEELAALIQVAPPHVQRVIVIGSQFGVRVGECELFGLTWNDVDFIREVLRVQGSKKNAEQPWREIPIRKGLLDILKAWAMEDGQQGHLITYNGKPIKSIKRAWRDALKNAGITRFFRPYDLRHSFATEILAAGGDVGTVAKLMGHSTPTMVLKHYQHVLDRRKREVVEMLPMVSYVPKLMCPKNAEVLN